LPLNGNLAFASGVVDTLPIATIQGGGAEYLELYWDRTAYDGAGGGMAFKLTDGTNTISLDTTQSEAMTWLHNDLLKFSITSNGVATTLYCFNPENGAIHGTAILINSGGAVLTSPTQIILGANDAEDVIGAGAFANIRGFQGILSASEVEEVFNSPGAIDPSLAGKGNYGPRRSNFGDKSSNYYQGIKSNFGTFKSNFGSN
jgi:hypothetical protein